MSAEGDFETAVDSYPEVEHFVDALDNEINTADVNNNNNNSNVDDDDEEDEGVEDENNNVQSNKTGNVGVAVNDDGQSNISSETPISEKTQINKEGEASIDENAVKKFWSGMKFYVNDSHDAHDNANDAKTLIRLIQENGGEILDELPDLHDHSNSEGNTLVVSPYNDTNLVTVTPTYIKSCAGANMLLNYQAYLVPFDKNRVSENENKNEEETKAGNDQDNDNGNDSFDPNIDHNLVSDKDLAAAAAAAAIVVGNKSDNTNESPSIGTFKQDNGLNQVKPDLESELSVVDTSSSSNDTSVKSTPIPASLSSHKNNFTEDEDQFILDVVRKNPTRRSTHTLFDEISKYMPNHTGNSIRHRFRGYLSKKLKFVFEVDMNGKLVRDDHGNLIKTSVLPPSLKRKFTSDEDYGLAIAVKKQFYRDIYQVDPETGNYIVLQNPTASEIARRNMTMDPDHKPGSEPTFQDFKTNGRRGPVAREFFKTYAEMTPTHTESAWRDRFRKFLLVYGIDSYIEYYEACKATNKEPAPLKNMTVRKKKRGENTPGNYTSASKRASTVSETSMNAIHSKRRHYMDSTESELAKNEQPARQNNNAGIERQNNTEVTLQDANGVVMANNVKNTANNTDVTVNDTRANNDTTQVNSTEQNVALEHNQYENDINVQQQQQQQQRTVNVERSLDNENHPTSQSKANEDFENDILDEETRNFISSLKDDLSRIGSNNNLPFEYPADVADAIREDYHMEEMRYDNIDPSTLQWPPKVASMELFLPKFFQLGSTQEFMERVNDVISRDYEPSQAEMLVQNLADECGIRRNFCTAMLTSLSGDLMVIPRYFLNMFQSGTNPPPNVPGIWTAQDDAMLRSGTDEDFADLDKKHGAGRIEMRKRFIETALI